MKQEIKKRIEEINNGIVPEGYEKTDFGIFPCDWGKKKLGDLLQFKNGVNADKDKYDKGIKMISVMDILTNQPILYNSIIGQVDIDANTLDKFSVTYGDILFQRSSETFEDAGKSNVYLDKDNIATFSGFVIRGKKIGEYNPYFLNNFLQLSSSRKQIIRNAAGSQHINIGQESLEPIHVFSPKSEKEQSKIAEILMKWDDAITLQEQYIQKLEERKKVLSCSLLEFNSKDVLTIQDCIDKKYCRLVKTSELKKFDGERIYLSTSSIVKNEIMSNEGKITWNNRPSRAQMLPKANAVWFAKMANSVKVYKFSQKEENLYVLSTGFYGLLCDENKIDSNFLVQVLMSSAFNKNKDLFAEGSSQNGIKDNNLSDLIIYLPDINRQKIISNILSKADEEISLQKEKLEKLKLQRKAMQQYLLTGVVRAG